MGTMGDQDYIDRLHQELLSVGKELEKLGHEHILITVLHDQLSVFSSGKGKAYLEGHWQFITNFVTFCEDYEVIKLLGTDNNATLDETAKPHKTKCSSHLNCKEITLNTPEPHKNENTDPKSFDTANDPFDGDTDIEDLDDSVPLDESDNNLSQTETEDSTATSSPHKKKSNVGKVPKTEENTKTRNTSRTSGQTTKKRRKASGRRKNDLANAKLPKVEVVLEDVRKLYNSSKTSRKKENQNTEQRTNDADNNAIDNDKKSFACDFCPEKLESQELLKSHLELHNDLTCSLCKKQFHTASELTAHNQEHIDSEGCFSCQLCDNKLFKFEWQLGQHMERDHSQTSSVEEGHFPCCECGYIFKYQNHLDEHQQVLPDCKNEKPAKQKEKEFFDSVTSFPDPKSGEMKTKKWRELFSRQKYPAKCEMCGKSLSIRQQYIRHVWTHADFKAHKCFICSRTFKFDDVLQKHLKVHDERPFHCEHCHFKFDTEARRDHHVKMTCTKLKDKPDLVCKECGRQFSSIFKLNDHLVFHSGETPWACDKCVYAAPTKQKLTRHKRVSHKEVLPFKCEQCGLMFGQNMALLTHMKTHEEKKFECKICGQKLANKSNLEQHMKKIHEEKRMFPCDQCSAVFYRPVRLQDHLRRHTGEKPYTCERCGMSFFKKQRLAEHIRTHTKERPFTCPECGKRFTTFQSLRVHRQTHNPNRCFICDQCGRTFKSQSHLSYHHKSHTDGHRWPCMYCELQYKSIAAYKTHLAKVHPDQKEDIERRTAIRLHQCELCSKMYSDKTDLQRHHLIHQGLKPFQCAYCEKAFNDKSNLRCHERIHTGEARERCKFCSKVFLQPRGLRLHVQKVHRQMMDQNMTAGRSVKRSSSEEFATAVNNTIEEKTEEECQKPAVVAEPVPHTVGFQVQTNHSVHVIAKLWN